MEVYIEYVILDNLIINCLLLFLVNKLCQLNLKFKNLMFASLIGTIFVIFMPLIASNIFLMLVYRFLTAFVMILSLSKFNKVKKFISAFLTLLFVTFLFGGLLIATLNMFDIVYTSSGLIFLSFELPISIFILPLIFYTVLFVKIFNYITEKIKISKFYYNIDIEIVGKKYFLKAFLDTGNNLYDLDGRPVVVLEFKTFCNMFPNFPIQKILLQSNDINEVNNAHYINVSTVSCSDKMLVFDADSIIIKKDNKKLKFCNVCIGISRKNFTEYNLILHKNFC